MIEETHLHSLEYPFYWVGTLNKLTFKLYEAHGEAYGIQSKLLLMNQQTHDYHLSGLEYYDQDQARLGQYLISIDDKLHMGEMRILQHFNVIGVINFIYTHHPESWG